MASCSGTYYLIVVEDTELAKIVASGTLVVEQKYIHEIAVVCIFVASFSNLLKKVKSVVLKLKSPFCGHFIDLFDMILI